MSTWREQETAKHLAYHAAGDWHQTPDGAYRWNTSQNTIPADIMANWAAAGLVTAAQLATHTVAARADLDAFLVDYRRRDASMTPAELEAERLAARAAHGPGVTLVNAVTGRKFTT